MSAPHLVERETLGRAPPASHGINRDLFEAGPAPGHPRMWAACPHAGDFGAPR